MIGHTIETGANNIHHIRAEPRIYAIAQTNKKVYYTVFFNRKNVSTSCCHQLSTTGSVFGGATPDA